MKPLAAAMGIRHTRPSARLSSRVGSPAARDPLSLPARADRGERLFGLPSTFAVPFACYPVLSSRLSRSLAVPDLFRAGPRRIDAAWGGRGTGGATATISGEEAGPTTAAPSSGRRRLGLVWIVPFRLAYCCRSRIFPWCFRHFLCTPTHFGKVALVLGPSPSKWGRFCPHPRLGPGALRTAARRVAGVHSLSSSCWDRCSRSPSGVRVTGKTLKGTSGRSMRGGLLPDRHRDRQLDGAPRAPRLLLIGPGSSTPSRTRAVSRSIPVVFLHFSWWLNVGGSLDPASAIRPLFLGFLKGGSISSLADDAHAAAHGDGCRWRCWRSTSSSTWCSTAGRADCRSASRRARKLGHRRRHSTSCCWVGHRRRGRACSAVSGDRGSRWISSMLPVRNCRNIRARG